MNNDKRTVAKSKYPAEVRTNSLFAYLDEISQKDLLSADEEISLFQKIQNGDDVSRELFIESNLRLVVKEAKKYYVPGMNNLLDLIQEGNIGLLEAVEHFDVTKGCKFSTYAYYKIHKAIQRSLSVYDSSINIPHHKRVLIIKIAQAIDSFCIENNRKPSLDELSQILNVKVDKIKALMPFITKPLSLNLKIKEGEDEREVFDVFNLYYQSETSDLETNYIINETKEEFRSILNNVLKEKEIYILCSHFGLFDTQCKNIETLAAELNMSQQGVRQCEIRALEKLRKRLFAMNKSFHDFI